MCLTSVLKQFVAPGGLSTSTIPKVTIIGNAAYSNNRRVDPKLFEGAVNVTIIGMPNTI
jgi:hypothetical protein